MSVSLDDQIACVQRELGFRYRCYPAWVHKEKMTQVEVDRELTRMSAVLETLKVLRDQPKETTNGKA